MSDCPVYSESMVDILTPEQSIETHGRIIGDILATLQVMLDGNALLLKRVMALENKLAKTGVYEEKNGK